MTNEFNEDEQIEIEKVKEFLQTNDIEFLSNLYENYNNLLDVLENEGTIIQKTDDETMVIVGKFLAVSNELLTKEAIEVLESNGTEYLFNFKQYAIEEMDSVKIYENDEMIILINF